MKLTKQQPQRFIRLARVPEYFDVDRHSFNKYFRPYLTEIKIGPRMIVFDVLEISGFADRLLSNAKDKGVPGKESD